MAEVKMTAAEAKAAAHVDWAKLESQTEAELERHRLEDDSADIDPGQWAPAPGFVRQSLGLTQEKMAATLRVPVATWRNWEQGRVKLDPAIATLLRILWKEPEAALRALITAA